MKKLAEILRAAHREAAAEFKANPNLYLAPNLLEEITATLAMMDGLCPKLESVPSEEQLKDYELACKEWGPMSPQAIRIKMDFMKNPKEEPQVIHL